MFSTKFGPCPRLINFACRTCNYKCNITSQNNSYIQLAPIYTMRLKFQEIHPYNMANFLRYSSKTIEVPEIPSEMSPEEADAFGEMGNLKYEKVELDEEESKIEIRDKEARIKVSRKFKPSPGQYAKMIKNYIEKGDLKSANQVLEQCKLNRDKPTDYMYTLLIRAFALQGDIQSCFKYYNIMKDRKLKIKANAYVSLLNACANSPDSDKALNYVQRVIDDMTKKEFELNHAHYNILLKAYGRHSKLDKAFDLVKEMEDKKVKIGISTINSLLYGANSNKESGLKYILLIWQLMQQKKIPPNIFTYHLLLRGIRDTHFGNCTLNDLLLPGNEHAIFQFDNNRPNLLQYPPVISDLPLKNIQHNNKTDVIPLLDYPKFNTSALTSSELSDSTATEVTEKKQNYIPDSIRNLNLDAILKQNKLVLFGGLDALINKMKNDNIKSDIKMVTYLMELVPDSTAAEEAVIKYAKLQRIPFDIDFFNMLIKKRCLRDAKNDAKDVLKYIHKADLKPNIVTYGVLAMTCSTSRESKELLETIKTTGLSVNKYIADTLLNSAFLRKDFAFILELMETIKYERIRLDESTFEKMDEFQQKMSSLVKNKHKSTEKDYFKVGFSKFNMRYKSWQEDMGRKIMTESEPKKK